MKIVITDDDSLSRFLLQNALEDMGHEVVVLEDGRQAWELYEKEHYSLLIADWMMPNIDGLQLCRMIRAERHEQYTFIILLTALGGKGSFLEGMDAGADDFITKPFDREQLAARLRVAERILQLDSQVKQLQGLLPICSYCKKIHDEEKDRWLPVEHFVASHTRASFTHGMCQECYAEQMAEIETSESAVPSAS